MPDWLLVTPTEMERNVLTHQAAFQELNLPLEVCGFGPISCAAAISKRIVDAAPSRVLLIGIAGGYSADIVGKAFEFGQVSIDGIGCGHGMKFQTAGEMGWQQWQSGNELIGDEIQLSRSNQNRLLTVCAASADQKHAELRSVKYNAIAEDMEGFGAAMACKLANIPLTIVRGISNVAGDRNHDRWQTTEALARAAELANQKVRMG